jgi:hypothetical protein
MSLERFQPSKRHPQGVQFQQQGAIDTFEQHTFQPQGATGMYQLYSLKMAL